MLDASSAHNSSCRPSLCVHVPLGFMTANTFIDPKPPLIILQPLYPTAMKTCTAFYVVFMAAHILYRQLCARENKRRDRLALEGNVEAIPKFVSCPSPCPLFSATLQSDKQWTRLHRPAAAESNITDIDDLAFRYVL